MLVPDAELAILSEKVYKTATFHLRRDVEVLVEERPDCVIFSFRGTEADFEDILSDIRGIPRYSFELGYWYHGGFLKGVSVNWPFLVSLAISFDKPIIATGHSKGGAEAGIFVSYLRSHNIPVEKLTVFGCPRFTNRWGHQLLEDVDCTFYVYGNDIVVEVPKLFYSHPVELIQLGSPNEGISGRFLDHKIRNYVECLTT